jgi:hypothetical protein
MDKLRSILNRPLTFGQTVYLLAFYTVSSQGWPFWVVWPLLIIIGLAYAVMTSEAGRKEP